MKNVKVLTAPQAQNLRIFIANVIIIIIGNFKFITSALIILITESDPCVCVRVIFFSIFYYDRK